MLSHCNKIYAESLRFFLDSSLFSNYLHISESKIFPQIFGTNTYPGVNSLQWTILHLLNPNLAAKVPQYSHDKSGAWIPGTKFPNNAALLALIGIHTKITSMLK